MVRPIHSHRRSRASARGRFALLPGTLVLGLLSFFAPSIEGANHFGGWVPAPDVIVPGTPRAELTINGAPYLLLESPDPATPLEAFLWNPTSTISLAPGPTIIIDFVSGFAGMQTATGALVFAFGNFEVAGTQTRLMMWDGSSWGLPGGPVLGVAPRTLRVRTTPFGPELWVAGDVMILPGLPGFTSVAHFDGTQWLSPGPVLGPVHELAMVDEGLPNGDVVYIAGLISSAGGIPTQRVARFDGTWSNLGGGLAGSDHLLSMIETTPGASELWVTLKNNLNRIELHRWHQGAWEDLTPPDLHGAVGPFGRVALLPTFFGPWVIGEGNAILGGEFGPPAWDPITETWRVVPTSSALAFSFDSPSGLFPPGIYDLESPEQPRRWEFSAFGTEEFIRGDANTDARVDLGDVIRILEAMFPSTVPPLPPLDCLDAADLNLDESVNLADAIYLLGALFGGTAAPNIIQPPFPTCDVGSTINSLGCVTGPPNCP